MVLHTIIPEIPDCGTHPRNSPTQNGLVSASNSFLDNGPSQLHSYLLHPSSNSTQGTYEFNYDVIPSLPSQEGSEHQGVDCALSVPVANFDSGMTPFTCTVVSLHLLCSNSLFYPTVMVTAITLDICCYSYYQAQILHPRLADLSSQTEYSIGEQCIFRPDYNESVFEHFCQNYNSMPTQTLEASSSYGTLNAFEQPMNSTAGSYQVSRRSPLHPRSLIKPILQNLAPYVPNLPS